MARRAAITDAATRAQALSRAEEIGDAAAAAEAGIAPTTLRSWRHRAGQESVESGRPAPAAGRGPEQLRADAQRAREAEARAVAKCDRLLSAGRASQAKAASDVAGQAGARALALERAAREEEQHQARLAESESRVGKIDHDLARKLVSYLLSGLGLPVTPEVESALWAGPGYWAEHGTPLPSGSIRAPRTHPPETVAASEAMDRVLWPNYRARFMEEFGIPEEEQAAHSEADSEREIEDALREALSSEHVDPAMRERIEAEGRSS